MIVCDRAPSGFPVTQIHSISQTNTIIMAINSTARHWRRKRWLLSTQNAYKLLSAKALYTYILETPCHGNSDILILNTECNRKSTPAGETDQACGLRFLRSVGPELASGSLLRLREDNAANQVDGGADQLSAAGAKRRPARGRWASVDRPGMPAPPSTDSARRTASDRPSASPNQTFTP